jgi:hypothetical protein
MREFNALNLIPSLISSQAVRSGILHFGHQNRKMSKNIKFKQELIAARGRMMVSTLHWE